MPDEIVRLIAEGESKGLDQVKSDLASIEKQAQSAGRAVDDLKTKMSGMSSGRMGVPSAEEQMRAQGFSEKDIQGFLGANYQGATTATEELSRAQKDLAQSASQVAPAVQQSSQAFSQSASATAPTAKNFGELSKELSEAKRAFDGSPESVKRLSDASREYNNALKLS